VTTATNIAMAPGLRVWAWTSVLAAGTGLIFLYFTTTSDPGFIPTGGCGSLGACRDGRGE
jgi:hypothetical protein